MDYRIEFSKRLIQLREQRGITQQELADKLKITRQSLSLYEKAERTINIELLARIADFFNVSTDYLMGRTDTATMNEDIQTACKITGLSEEAINKFAKILNDNEKYEYTITIDDIIGDYHFPELLYYINKYSKQELLQLLKKYMPDLKIFNDEKTILINGVDKEETEKNYSFIINNKSDKLLETADALSNILGINNVIFAINNKDSNNVINLTSNIGTYPNIKLKLVPDVYPIGFKNILMKNVLSKKEIENGVIYLTVEDLINIYNVLKRRKPIIEKYVTIGGNCIKESIVVNTKIGTKIADLIKNTCEIINEDYYVIVNGLISGITLESLNSIITLNTRSIFLNTLDKTSEKECINCGLCTMKCPVGLNPKYIKEHRKADKSKCINCGLCSYICPSKINFKECLNREE